MMTFRTVKHFMIAGSLRSNHLHVELGVEVMQLTLVCKVMPATAAGLLMVLICVKQGALLQDQSLWGCLSSEPAIHQKPTTFDKSAAIPDPKVKQTFRAVLARLGVVTAFWPMKTATKLAKRLAGRCSFLHAKSAPTVDLRRFFLTCQRKTRTRL